MENRLFEPEDEPGPTTELIRIRSRVPEPGPDIGNETDMDEATIEFRPDPEPDRAPPNSLSRAVIGAATVAAVGGLAFLVGRKMMEVPEGERISDAPEATFRGSRGKKVQRTVTINKPADELYAFWRDFSRLPQFMDNVEAIERIDGDRSRWTVKGPGGTSVELVTRVIVDEPGRRISWESEEESQIRNQGEVEFLPAPPGRGTYVRVMIDYDPPLGSIGRAMAKLLQREPAVQLRRDLRRFKQLMETGEVTSSAGPSGRRSEDPTQQYL